MKSKLNIADALLVWVFECRLIRPVMLRIFVFLIPARIEKEKSNPKLDFSNFTFKIINVLIIHIYLNVSTNIITPNIVNDKKEKRKISNTVFAFV